MAEPSEQAHRGRETGDGRDDAVDEDMRSEIDMVLAGIREGVRDQARRHPYAALGAAAAVGYVLGGGLPKVVTTAIVAAGVRYAIYRTMRKTITRYT